MSYRTIFREAVGTIPPTSIDLERVIRRQRRRRRLARIGLSGGAAAAVTVIAVGAAAALGGGGVGDPTPAASASAGTPTPAASASVSPQPPLPSLPATAKVEYEVEVRDRITKAARAALRDTVPGVRWLPESSLYDPPTDRDTFWTSGYDRGYVSEGNIMAGGRRARAMIFVQVAVKSSVKDVSCPSPDSELVPHCATRVERDGERVLWATSFPPSETDERLPGPAAPAVTATPDPSWPYTRFEVKVLRTDGMLVTVRMDALGDEAPMTIEQALAIAKKPDLTLN